MSATGEIREISTAHGIQRTKPRKGKWKTRTPLTEKVQFLISKEELSRIDEWRSNERMFSRSGAIRAACYCYISLSNSGFFIKQEERIEQLENALEESAREIQALQTKLAKASAYAEAEATKKAAAMLYARSKKLEAAR